MEQFIGRQEVSVEVRLPEQSRNSLSELYRLPVRTPDGMSVPLSRVADITLVTPAACSVSMGGGLSPSLPIQRATSD